MLDHFREMLLRTTSHVWVNHLEDSLGWTNVLYRIILPGPEEKAKDSSWDGFVEERQRLAWSSRSSCLPFHLRKYWKTSHASHWHVVVKINIWGLVLLGCRKKKQIPAQLFPRRRVIKSRKVSESSEKDLGTYMRGNFSALVCVVRFSSMNPYDICTLICATVVEQWYWLLISEKIWNMNIRNK